MYESYLYYPGDPLLKRRNPEETYINYNFHDPEEFSHIYDEVFPKLFSYVAYRVERKQDAEDIVSKTFLKVVENYHKFENRHPGSIKGWIFKIAHNLIKNYYRNNGRNRIPLSIDEIHNIDNNKKSVHNEVVDREIYLILVKLINNLSPRQAEIIRLKFIGGFRNQEIAEILYLDEHTVAAYLSRGLKTLVDIYSSYINTTIEVKLDE